MRPVLMTFIVTSLLIPLGTARAQADGAAIDVLGKVLPTPPGSIAYGSVIITPDRLQTTASNRIEDALRDVAGFQQFRRSDSRSANPSAQGATLRALGGNASSRTLVLLDGVPVADPFFGYIPFDAIAPQGLGSIRITRGAGAGAFGAGAVAGVIEMESIGRADLPLLSANAAYGSDNASELSATLSPNLGGGYVSISGRWDRGDGFDTTPAYQRVAATVPARYHNWSMGVHAVAPLSGSTEVQFRGLVYRDNRTLRFAGANSMSQGHDVSIRLVSRGPWQIDALAYLQMRDFSNIVISASTFTKSLDQRATPSSGLGGKIELRPPVGPDHVLRVGVDTRLASGTMYEDAYSTTARPNFGQMTARRHAFGSQSTGGLFIEDNWTLGPLVMTAGGRVDRWRIYRGVFENVPAAGVQTRTLFPNRNGVEGTGRAGLQLHVKRALALRAAAYTNYRLPTLNELYRAFVVFPVTTQANPSLASERLKGCEAGMDLTPRPDVLLSITGFYNRLDHAIANVTIGKNLRQRQNINAIVAKGIEVTANARFGSFALSTSYAYSNSKVRAPGQAFDSFAPSQSPRHNASGTLSYTMPHRGPFLAATLRYVGRAYEDDLQTDVLPSAITLDAIASVHPGQGIGIRGRIENVFNTTVVTRNIGGSMDLGTPRRFWISVSFNGTR